jgi:hypothetical protein
VVDFLNLARGGADLLFRASGMQGPDDMRFSQNPGPVATSSPINPLGETGRQTYNNNRPVSSDPTGPSPVGDRYNPEGVNRGAGEAGGNQSPAAKLAARVSVGGMSLPLAAWLALAAVGVFIMWRVAFRRGR